MAYSGNLFDYNEIVRKWNTEADHEVFLKWDYLAKAPVVIVSHKRNRLVLVEKHFAGEPNMRDEDVMYTTVTAWLRKQYEDYMLWYTYSQDLLHS